MASSEYHRRYTLTISPPVICTCEQVKTFQMRGARRFEEQRRPSRLHRGDAKKRHQVNATFSPARSLRSLLGEHLVNQAALIEFFQNAVVDQLFRLNFFNFRITSFHQSHDVADTRWRSVWLLVCGR